MTILSMYAGVEDLDLDNVVEDVTVAVEEAVKTEIAEVAVAIEENSNQIEELVEAVEELEEASEEVVEVVEGLESLLNSGNYNATAFAYQYNRASKLAAKLGGRQGSRLGSESLGDASTAQLMAREGIEGFMETVKSWGKKAAEFIKHIFNTVINFFTSLFNQSGALEKRAKQLEERLANGKLVEDVKLGSWNAYFDYAASKGANKFSDLKSPDEAVSAMIDLASRVEGVDKTSAFKTIYGTTVKWLQAQAAPFKTTEKAGDEEDTKVVIGQVAAIRLMVEYKKPDSIKEMADCVKAVSKTKIYYKIDGETAGKLKTGTEKPALNVGQLKGLISDVVKFAKELRESKVKAKFSKAERDRVVGMLTAIKATEESGDTVKNIEQGIKLARATFATAANMTQSSFKFQTSMNKAQLDMVAAHIK